MLGGDAFAVLSTGSPSLAVSGCQGLLGLPGSQVAEGLFGRLCSLDFSVWTHCCDLVSGKSAFSHQGFSVTLTDAYAAAVQSVG